MGQDRAMATSGRGGLRWIGEQPACAICASARNGPAVEHHLTHGVSVWLCKTHRSEAFVCRRGGRDLVECLTGLWQTAGCLNNRQRAALATHLRRVGGAAVGRKRPGSYSWPRLRAEAERRFAAGEPPRRVISKLRVLHAGDTATVPSVRTMRRWFTQARWLARAATPSRFDDHARTYQPTGRPTRRHTDDGDPLLKMIRAWGWWYGLPRGDP
jgi:hypothetical protein